MADGRLLFCALDVESGPLIIHSIIGTGRVGREGALTTPRSAVKQLHIRGSGVQSLMIESGGPWSTNSLAVIYE